MTTMPIKGIIFFLCSIFLTSCVTIGDINAASGKPKALEMVKELLDGHETISQTANKVAVIAQEHGDEGTADLMIQRIQEHDKTPWMLRSFLDN